MKTISRRAKASAERTPARDIDLFELFPPLPEMLRPAVAEQQWRVRTDIARMQQHVRRNAERQLTSASRQRVLAARINAKFAAVGRGR